MCVRIGCIELRAFNAPKGAALNYSATRDALIRNEGRSHTQRETHSYATWDALMPQRGSISPIETENWTTSNWITTYYNTSSELGKNRPTAFANTAKLSDQLSIYVYSVHGYCNNQEHQLNKYSIVKMSGLHNCIIPRWICQPVILKYEIQHKNSQKSRLPRSPSNKKVWWHLKKTCKSCHSQ